ncbi:hypothetical protein K438DRAFT_1783090 [Mycena galopus ATCC 62051]|nr:hypothetical protein K438DRAFT_1783090 [Mycena galopus ATCC 62051]
MIRMQLAFGNKNRTGEILPQRRIADERGRDADVDDGNAGCAGGLGKNDGKLSAGDLNEGAGVLARLGRALTTRVASRRAGSGDGACLLSAQRPRGGRRWGSECYRSRCCSATVGPPLTKRRARRTKGSRGAQRQSRSVESHPTGTCPAYGGIEGSGRSVLAQHSGLEQRRLAARNARVTSSRDELAASQAHTVEPSQSYGKPPERARRGRTSIDLLLVGGEPSRSRRRRRASQLRVHRVSGILGSLVQCVGSLAGESVVEAEAGLGRADAARNERTVRSPSTLRRAATAAGAASGGHARASSAATRAGVAASLRRLRAAIGAASKTAACGGQRRAGRKRRGGDARDASRRMTACGCLLNESAGGFERGLGRQQQGLDTASEGRVGVRLLRLGAGSLTERACTCTAATRVDAHAYQRGTRCGACGLSEGTDLDRTIRSWERQRRRGERARAASQHTAASKRERAVAGAAGGSAGGRSEQRPASVRVHSFGGTRAARRAPRRGASSVHDGGGGAEGSTGRDDEGTGGVHGGGAHGSEGTIDLMADQRERRRVLAADGSTGRPGENSSQRAARYLSAASASGSDAGGGPSARWGRERQRLALARGRGAERAERRARRRMSSMRAARARVVGVWDDEAARRSGSENTGAPALGLDNGLAYEWNRTVANLSSTPSAELRNAG